MYDEKLKTWKKTISSWVSYQPYLHINTILLIANWSLEAVFDMIKHQCLNLYYCHGFSLSVENSCAVLWIICDIFRVKKKRERMRYQKKHLMNNYSRTCLWYIRELHCSQRFSCLLRVIPPQGLMLLFKKPEKTASGRHL